MQQELKQRNGYKIITFPGVAQVFYGDESSRSLIVEGTEGDATCALFMNWERHSVKSCYKKALLHWQKTGSSEKPPSLLAGVHKKLAHSPILFNVSRRL
jgi:alpha-amylase